MLQYFLPAVLFLGLVHGYVDAGVLITVENRSLDGNAPELIVSKIAIDGNRVRIDHDEPKRSGRGSVIYRGDKKQMIVLNHRGSSFQILTKESMKTMSQQSNQQMSAVMEQIQSKLAQLPPAERKMMEQMMGQQMPAAPPVPKQKAPAYDVRKTGATRKIGGYATEQYEVFENGNRVREIWTTDWEAAGVRRNDFKVFKEMHQFQQEAFASMNRGSGFQASDAAFDEFRRVDGLPVMIISFEGGVKTRETSLKSVEQRTFNDSYFTPPQNYEEKRGLATGKRNR